MDLTFEEMVCSSFVLVGMIGMIVKRMRKVNLDRSVLCTGWKPVLR
jgi:hypothetical protein